MFPPVFMALRRLRRLCTALGVIAVGYAATADFSAIDARIQSWVDRGYYPHASLLVAQHGRVIHQRTFGPCTADTEVFIASAGKWLAAATLMTLVDDGTLSLGDPAARWIPELANDPKGRATLRQLLSHTSGYPPYQPKDRPVDRYQTLAESVAALAPLPPERPPGQRFEYGGLAMQVAGRMAERAAGKDWDTLFQERIARPCGMTHTAFTPVDAGGGHSPMLGGGAHSTLHDYAAFLAMLTNDGVANGRRVLSPAAIAEMQADQVQGASVQREEFVERVRGQTHRGVYGLGEWREQVDAAGRAVLLSSPSWAGTYPWIDKTNGVYGIILAHVSPAAGTAGFSGFWTSPVLAPMVRRALNGTSAAAPAEFARGTVPVDGADLYYEAAGRGSPVVLIHAHSVDSRMWDEEFAALARTHRVIRYDLRGYGLSDAPVEGRPFTHADDLHRLIIQLGLGRVHLVGLSLGAFVAADLLALHPEEVRSVSIASGGVYRGSGREPSPDERARRLEEIEELRRQGVDGFKQEWMAAMMRSCGSRGEAVRGRLGRMIDEWPAWQPLHVEPALLLGERLPALLERNPVSVPVLIIQGAEDSAGSHRSSARLAKAIPSARVVTIPDAGHWSNLEQPAAFLRAVEGTIAAAEPASANPVSP